MNVKRFKGLVRYVTFRFIFAVSQHNCMWRAKENPQVKVQNTVNLILTTARCVLSWEDSLEHPEFKRNASVLCT